MEYNKSIDEMPSCTTSSKTAKQITVQTKSPKNKTSEKKAPTAKVSKKRTVKKSTPKVQTTKMSVSKFFEEYFSFKKLNDYIPWETQPMGEENFCCDSTIIETNLKEYHAITIELFIRKYLCRKFNTEIKDYNCNKVLRNEIMDLEFRERLQDSYEVYTDPETNAIDVIDDIKTVALSNRLAFNDMNENINDADSMVINESNLNEICKFLDTLPYKNMVAQQFLALKLNNIRLSGLVNYIFDDHVFCQIVTSESYDAYKYKGPRVLFYILAHYNKKYYDDQLSKNYTIIIYNSLLCFTHTAEIVITPDAFDAVKECIEDAIEGHPVNFDGLFE